MLYFPPSLIISCCLLHAVVYGCVKGPLCITQATLAPGVHRPPCAGSLYAAVWIVVVTVLVSWALPSRVKSGMFATGIMSGREPAPCGPSGKFDAALLRTDYTLGDTTSMYYGVFRMIRFLVAPNGATIVHWAISKIWLHGLPPPGTYLQHSTSSNRHPFLASTPARLNATTDGQQQSVSHGYLLGVLVCSNSQPSGTM